MIIGIYIAFLLLVTYGESYDQLRNCPPINNEPHHIVQNHRDVMDTTVENVVWNLNATKRELAAAVSGNATKWPKGTAFDGKYEVPYKFYKSVPQQMREAVYFGMVIIERGTNIIFIRKRKTHKNYIIFRKPKADNACYSTVRHEKTVITIGAPCREPHYMIYQLLRVLGMKNEHQRTDRSISRGTWEHGENVAPDANITGLTIYDPFSIMHFLLPPKARLIPTGTWTESDTQLTRVPRAFPTLCDFSGINEVYKGHVQSPPCTNIRIQPLLLEATEEGNRQWRRTFRGRELTWVCNWMSGARIGEKTPLTSHDRKERTFCQFPANNMYPSVWWIPYAEEITYPLPELNYSGFKTFPNKVKPNWMTHDVCDCLGPPPSFTSVLNDHSMYQACLECVHFKDTTTDVLKCIAKRTRSFVRVLGHLQESYNQTQYYLINPSSK